MEYTTGGQNQKFSDADVMTKSSNKLFENIKANPIVDIKIVPYNKTCLNGYELQ